MLGELGVFGFPPLQVLPPNAAFEESSSRCFKRGLLELSDPQREPVSFKSEAVFPLVRVKGEVAPVSYISSRETCDGKIVLKNLRRVPVSSLK